MKLLFNWFYLKVRKVEPFILPFVIFVSLTIFLPSLLMLSYSFQSLADKGWTQFTDNLFWSFLLSFLVSFISLVVTLLIAFPLSVLIWSSFSLKARKKIFLLLSFPLISNYFIRLIGLKSCFDFFNGSLNSTYGFGYTIIGLVFLALPLVIYNFVNTLVSFPNERRWAIRDLGYTSWGELFFLLLPWSKTTFISSSIFFFLPSLFTTFISEFLNNDPSSQMVGEVVYSIYSLTSAFNNSRPFIALLVSVLFTTAIFTLTFSSSFFRLLDIVFKSTKKKLQLRIKKKSLEMKAKQNFLLNI